VAEWRTRPIATTNWNDASRRMREMTAMCSAAAAVAAAAAAETA